MGRHHLRALLLVLLLPAVPSFAQDNLLILAPKGFIDALQPLRRFKEASGRRTWLLSLDQVYAGWSGADEAEQVKRCIEHHVRNDGVEYVMLVGDIELFPARYRWWGLPGQEGWAISDLYYADLYKQGTTTFDDWDDNNNGLYGEIEWSPNGTINNDDIDFLPDVAVGRVPASTVAEVKAYVNKVISYEMKTVPWSDWFEGAGLYTGTWMNVNSLKDEIGGWLSAQGHTLTKRYTSWIEAGNPSAPAGMPNAFYSDLNAGMGLVNYVGHGSPECLSCLSVCSSGLTNLTNTNKLPVIFAGACDTGRIAWLARLQPYVDTNGTEHCGTANGESLPVGSYPYTAVPRPAPIQDDGGDGHVQCAGGTVCTNCAFDPPALAESFLFGNPVGQTGAIAYLGARSGGQVTMKDLDRHFFAAYYDDITVLGDMWTYMIEQYYSQYDLGQAHSWSLQPSSWGAGHTFDEPQKLLLFGDPSLIIGGAYATTLPTFPFDGYGGPLEAYSRHRLNTSIAVPTGDVLTAYPGASLFFEAGTSLAAYGSDSTKGFIVDGSTAPVHFLSLSANPQADHVVHGVKIRGEMKIRNGGAIRLD